MGSPTRVLIVSSRDDWSAEQVVTALMARGVDYRWVDPADFPRRMSLAARLGSGFTGLVHIVDSKPVEVTSFDAVFYRRPGDFDMPDGLSGPEARFARAQARVGLGGVLASVQARWINHPSALADAEYKPRQLVVAERVGLNIPPTLITNEPDAVREFAEQVGPLVVKPLAESIVSEADGYTLAWTRRVTDEELDDLTGVEVTAHLFQQWVPKRYDVRLTAVGDRMFPVAIHASSEATRVDWRTDYDALSYELVPCPDTVATGVRAFLTAAGLRYAAFDFAVRDDGQWLFLEFTDLVPGCS